MACVQPASDNFLAVGTGAGCMTSLFISSDVLHSYPGRKCTCIKTEAVAGTQLVLSIPCPAWITMELRSP